MNLIDGADGVAATLGIGIFASLGIVAALTQGIGTAVVHLAMSGALLGFLLFNFPPAKLYLGDSGSMLIGLVAAAAAIQSSTKESGDIRAGGSGGPIGHSDYGYEFGDFPSENSPAAAFTTRIVVIFIIAYWTVESHRARLFLWSPDSRC